MFPFSTFIHEFSYALSPHSYMNSVMHYARATDTFIHEFSYAFLLAKRSDRREGPFIWAKHLIALLEKLHFARTLSSIITR